MSGDDVTRVLSAKTLYEVLGLETSCSIDDVKRSYRRTAVKVHPDRCQHPRATEAFQRISHAYQVLSDENKRAHYDRFGDAAPEQQPRRAQQGGVYRQDAYGNYYTFQDEVSPEDIFAMFFGMRPTGFARPARQPRQANVRVNFNWGILSYIVPMIIVYVMNMFMDDSGTKLVNVIKFGKDIDRMQHQIFTSTNLKKEFGVSKIWLRDQANRGRLTRRFYSEMESAADDIYVQNLRSLCSTERLRNLRIKEACDELREVSLLL